MDRKRILACVELETGDAIEARLGPILHFTGCVTEVQTDQELFWATDSIGHRRLIDFGSYDVFRVYPAVL